MSGFNLFLKRDMSRANTAVPTRKRTTFEPVAGLTPATPVELAAGRPLVVLSGKSLMDKVDEMARKASEACMLPPAMIAGVGSRPLMPVPNHEGVVLVGDVWRCPLMATDGWDFDVAAVSAEGDVSLRAIGKIQGAWHSNAVIMLAAWKLVSRPAQTKPARKPGEFRKGDKVRVRMTGRLYTLTRMVLGNSRVWYWAAEDGGQEVWGHVDEVELVEEAP